MRIYRAFFLILITMNIIACSSGDTGESNSDLSSNATFTLDPITSTSIEPGQSNAIWQIPESKLISFKACLINQATTDKVGAGIQVAIKENNELITNKTTDNSGCVHWTEEFYYTHAAKEVNVTIERQIFATSIHQGNQMVRLAINPWRTNPKEAVKDLAFQKNSIKNLIEVERTEAALTGSLSKINSNESNLFVEKINASISTDSKLQSELQINFQPNLKRQYIDSSELLEKITSGAFKIEAELIESKQGNNKSLIAISTKISTKAKIKSSVANAFTSFHLLRLPAKLSKLILKIKIIPEHAPYGMSPIEGSIDLGEFKQQIQKTAVLETKLDSKAIESNQTIKKLPTKPKSKSTKTVDTNSSPSAGVGPDSQQVAVFQNTQNSTFKIKTVNLLEINSDVDSISPTTMRATKRLLYMEACLKAIVSRTDLDEEKKFTLKKMNGEKIQVETEDNGCFSWHDSIDYKYFSTERWFPRSIQVTGLKDSDYEGSTQTKVLYINPWRDNKEALWNARYDKKPYEKHIDGTKEFETYHYSPQFNLEGIAFNFIGRSVKLDRYLNLLSVRYYDISIKPTISRMTIKKGIDSKGSIGNGRYRVTLLLERTHPLTDREYDTANSQDQSSFQSLKQLDKTCFHKDKLFYKIADPAIRKKCYLRSYISHWSKELQAKNGTILIPAELVFRDLRYVMSRNILSVQIEPVDTDSELNSKTFVSSFEPIRESGFRRLSENNEHVWMLNDQLLNSNPALKQAVEVQSFNTPKNLAELSATLKSTLPKERRDLPLDVLYNLPNRTKQEFVPLESAVFEQVIKDAKNYATRQDSARETIKQVYSSIGKDLSSLTQLESASEIIEFVLDEQTSFLNSNQAQMLKAEHSLDRFINYFQLEDISNLDEKLNFTDEQKEKLLAHVRFSQEETRSSLKDDRNQKIKEFQKWLNTSDLPAGKKAELNDYLNLTKLNKRAEEKLKVHYRARVLDNEVNRAMLEEICNIVAPYDPKFDEPQLDEEIYLKGNPDNLEARTKDEANGLFEWWTRTERLGKLNRDQEEMRRYARMSEYRKSLGQLNIRACTKKILPTCSQDPLARMNVTATEHLVKVNSQNLDAINAGSTNIAVMSSLYYSESDMYSKSRRKSFSQRVSNEFGFRLKVAGASVGQNWEFGKSESWDTSSLKSKSLVTGSSKTINAEHFTYKIDIDTISCLVFSPKNFYQTQEKENSSSYYLCAPKAVHKPNFEETWYYVYLFFRSISSPLMDAQSSFVQRPWTMILRSKSSFAELRNNLEDATKMVRLRQSRPNPEELLSVAYDSHAAVFPGLLKWQQLRWHDKDVMQPYRPRVGEREKDVEDYCSQF